MKTAAAAIDFGTSKIVTLLAESGGFTRCDIIGSGTVPYDGYQDGAWNAPDQVEQAIRGALSAAEVEARRRISEVYVGVPCEYIHVINAEGEVAVSSADGRVSEADTDAVQDAAADALRLAQGPGVVIHRSPAWFTVDGGKKTMQPIGARGSRLRALVSFITASPDFIRNVRAMLGRMGVVASAFLSPAMGSAILLLTLEERDRTAALIDVGYLNTEVSVVEGDAITYHAVIPMGGGHLAADLAEALEIGLPAAEGIKRDYIFMPDEFDAAGDPEVRFDDGTSITFPREFVKRTIEGSFDELADMIGQTLKHAAGNLGPRAQIFLTGGGISMMRGGKEYLAERLGRPVKIPMARAAKLNSPKYASSLGLVDLIFDSLEQQSTPGDSIRDKLTGNIKKLIRR